MEYLVSLVAITVVALLFHNAIRKWPAIFYLLTLVTTLIVVCYPILVGGVPPAWARWFFKVIQHCTLAFALFTLVMFIGVLPKSSKAYAALAPIRGELAIMAFFLCLGHVGNYFKIFLMRALNGSADPLILGGFLVALVLTLLVVVLSVTSFRRIRTVMKSVTWIRLQKAAYLFFVLVFVHVAFMVAPAALRHGTSAMIDIGIYTLVILLYGGLIIRRRFVQKADVALGIELQECHIASA